MTPIMSPSGWDSQKKRQSEVDVGHYFNDTDLAIRYRLPDWPGIGAGAVMNPDDPNME